MIKTRLLNTNISSEKRTDYTLLCIIISVYSLVVGFMALGQGSSTMYRYVFVIPIAFGVLTGVFFMVYRNITLISGMIIAFMFIRYTVTVQCLMLEDFPRSVYHVTYDQSNAINAVMIMCFEMLVFYVALYLTRLKKAPKVSNEEYISKLLIKRNFANLGIMIIGLVVFTIGIFAVWPSLFNNYSFIINSELDALTQTIISSQSSLPRGMRWVGYTCGEASRYILIEFIVLWCFKKFSLSNKNRYWYISLLLVGINGVITTTRIMLGIFSSIVFIEQIYYLYPQKRKLLARIGIVVGASFVGLIAVVYLSNAMKYHSISQLVQGYTNGYFNVYQSLAAYANANQGMFEKIEMFFVGDGLANVNVVSLFVDGINSSNIYNYYIYGLQFNGGAVLPFVSQMSYYFSPFIGPIFSGLCVYEAKKYEVRWKACKGNILINGLMSIVFAAIPFAYNYSTAIHIFTVVVLPLWICYKINRSVKIKA